MPSVILEVSYEVEVFYEQQLGSEEPTPTSCFVHTTVPAPMEPYLKIHAIDDFYRKWKEGKIECS